MSLCVYNIRAVGKKTLKAGGCKRGDDAEIDGAVSQGGDRTEGAKTKRTKGQTSLAWCYT